MEKFQDELLRDAGRLQQPELKEARMTLSNQDLSPAFRGDGSAGGVLQWLYAPARRGPLLIAPALLTPTCINILPLLWSFGPAFVTAAPIASRCQSSLATGTI